MHKTAKAAKAAGERHYLPDAPCKYGHFAPRQVSGSCLECLRVRNKARHHGCSVWEILVSESFFSEMVLDNSRKSGISLHSREDALSRGDRFYFDGMPCRVAGHLSKRYAKNKACLQCVEESYKDKEYMARKSDSTARWSERNPGRHKKLVSDWKRNNRHKGRASRAKRRAIEAERMPADFGELDELIMGEANRLAEVRSDMFGFNWHVDHMIPLQAKNASGLHCGRNIQVIPASLNCGKGNRLIYTEDLEWLADATSEE